MEKIDSRKLPEVALNERRRRAVKLRAAGFGSGDDASVRVIHTCTVVQATRRFGAGAGQQ
jgi:hypothetical protein